MQCNVMVMSRNGSAMQCNVCVFGMTKGKLWENYGKTMGKLLQVCIFPHYNMALSENRPGIHPLVCHFDLKELALWEYTSFSETSIYILPPPHPNGMGPQGQAPGSRFSCYLQHFRAPASNFGRYLHDFRAQTSQFARYMHHFGVPTSLHIIYMDNLHH